MTAYAWGLGKNGQLGNGVWCNENVPKPIRFDKSSQPKRYNLCRISSGGLFTSVVTASGELYSFGCGKHGRLGTGDEVDRAMANLIKFPDKVKIKEVSCGMWHTCALDTEGNLYSWGYNKFNKKLPNNIPQQVQALQGKQIVGVSCGNNFTLAWDVDGVCYSWGSGKYGVLGQGSEKNICEATQIDALADHKIVNMSAGYAHSSAVTDEGHIYMFGHGKYAALGLGQKCLTDAYSPMLLSTPESERFVRVSCSVGEHHGHTLALTTQGKVYAWGDGYKGKLGLGDQNFVYTPVQIPDEYFERDPVVSISAGGIHSSAVTSVGKVYTWGCGSDGRLGHPEAQGHRYLFRSDIPKHVEELKKKASKVSASYYHTVALLEI